MIPIKARWGGTWQTAWYSSMTERYKWRKGYKRFLQSKEKRVHKVQYLQDKNTLVYLG